MSRRRETFEGSAKAAAEAALGPGGGAVVDQDDPGGGILVDCKAIGRPVGDTSSSAVYVSDLPKNFHGGEEALHFALGQLFGQFGKIKKIELYMDKGILETEDFKGEALVVYHPSKKTGTREKGDPVYEACTDMDGKWRTLGYRMWRIRCEVAQWQKEGYDVKAKAKKAPCVELGNLWVYDPSKSLAWFMEMQDVIREHAAQWVDSPFVKVEPTEGKAIVWCKGAQEAIKFASVMHKSYFLGRKIESSLCRRERPMVQNLPKIPTNISLSVTPPSEVAAAKLAELRAAAAAAGVPPPPLEEPAADSSEGTSVSQQEPVFILKEGSKVVLKGLVAKPEDNGKTAEVMCYMRDVKKYRLRLDDLRCVKVKPANVELLHEATPPGSDAMLALVDEDMDDVVDTDAVAVAAQGAAANMAAGNVPHGAQDPNFCGFTPGVCVDPALLRKKPEDEEVVPVRRRESSRSRERRYQERVEEVKARLVESKGPRPGWVVSSPQEMATAAPLGGGGTPSALSKEPEETREELMKLSVSKLKEMLKDFGKTARGCIEKRDFVDRLKPTPNP
eukprot:TRINITY_DN67916_c0_g1_i1.p1 TRINITY_DN67916_c0_g1~~TRINITY_DN67916_c0_g1_i1.p1  ORF type:complete len:560 (-),score=106.74 TRINITY_DN67916_c0_g1_i1:118-1797(-)